MADRLAVDYENTEPMIFGQAPEFKAIMASIKAIEEVLSQPSLE